MLTVDLGPIATELVDTALANLSLDLDPEAKTEVIGCAVDRWQWALDRDIPPRDEVIFAIETALLPYAHA